MTGTEKVRGAWVVGDAFKSATRCRLDETSIEKLQVQRGVVDFDAGAARDRDDPAALNCSALFRPTRPNRDVQHQCFCLQATNRLVDK